MPKIKGNKFRFEDGLGDGEFTWYFAGALATNIVLQAVQEGFITDEAASMMTPCDLADIIKSKWFSDLIHSLAFAPLGSYGRFGRSYEDYYTEDPQRLNKIILSRLNSFGIDVSTHSDLPEKYFDILMQDDGVCFGPKFTAVHNPSHRKFLRRMMEAAGSLGCPAARKSSVIDLQGIGGDVKAALGKAVAKRLLEPVSDPRVKDMSRVRYTQNRSRYYRYDPSITW